MLGGAEPAGERQVAAVREVSAQAGEIGGETLIGGVGDEHGQQPLAICGEITPVQLAAALAGAPLADGQKPRQP